MGGNVYQKMIELSQPRNAVMQFLFVGALAIMLIHHAIDTSPIPVIKNHVSGIRTVYWLLVLVAYLALAIFLFSKFPLR